MAPHCRVTSGGFSLGCEETSRVTGSISYSMSVTLANAKVSAGKWKGERSGVAGAPPAAQPATSQRTGSMLWKVAPRLPRIRLSSGLACGGPRRVAGHGRRRARCGRFGAAQAKERTAVRGYHDETPGIALRSTGANASGFPPFDETQEKEQDDGADRRDDQTAEKTASDRQTQRAEQETSD